MIVLSTLSFGNYCNARKWMQKFRYVLQKKRSRTHNPKTVGSNPTSKRIKNSDESKDSSLFLQNMDFLFL